MTPLFKKLNYKPDMGKALILNAPESFDTELELLQSVDIKTEPEPTPFTLAFAITLEELAKYAKILAENTTGDAIVWIGYPKKSSKKYKGEFTRDDTWGAFADYGLEAVRNVAIDDDWSALRFRRVEFIKSMKRDSKRAGTKEGKKKTES